MPMGTCPVCGQRMEAFNGIMPEHDRPGHGQDVSGITNNPIHCSGSYRVSVEDGGK